MSEALDKARGALDAAREVLTNAQPDDTIGASMTLKDQENYSRLVYAASVQANVAQAEALERIADALEGR